MSSDMRFGVALALFALGFVVLLAGIDRGENRRRRISRMRDDLERLERRQRIEEALEQELAP